MRILVVDDEAGLRDLAAALLTSDGHEVEKCAGSVEAVGRARARLDEGHPFDLLLLDLHLGSGEHGEELLQTIRSFQPGVAAVASSGTLQSDSPPTCTPEGFQGFLAKPYTVADFRHLFAVLDGSRGT